MSFIQLLENLSKKRGEQLAVVSDNQSISYKQLFNVVILNASIIRTVRQCGSAVLLDSDDKFTFVILLFSYIIAGVWCVPISSDINNDTKIKIKVKYKLDTPLPEEQLLFVAEECKNNVSDYEFDLEAGILHLTSGSTGFPKLCVRSIDSLILEGKNYQKKLSIQQNDKILSLAPIDHSFALGAALMGALVSEATLFVSSKFNPRKSIFLMNKYQPNIIVTVPIMIQTMNKVRVMEEIKLLGFRMALVGAGALNEKEQEKFIKRFGAPIVGNYGSTETGGLFTRLESDFPLSIGIPMEGIEVKLLDDKKEEVEDGVIGEIYVKCPYSMKGYYLEDTQAIAEDGFFPMGDLARKDPNGIYYIVGRKKNVIRIAGKNVYPYEVEHCLLNNSSVKDAYVYEEKRKGVSIIAAIVVDERMDEALLRQNLAQTLERYKIPTKIYFRNSIKRNAAGKVINNS